MVALQVADQRLPDLAAQVQHRWPVDPGDQHPEPDEAADGVRDLQDPDPFVPDLGGGQGAVEFGPQVVERHPPVDVEFDGAEYRGFLAGPVLERGGGEVGGRQDQPPVVPDVHHHIGQGDFLDPAPFVLHHHHVVDPDRVGERQLQPGEQVRQRRLRRQTGHDAEHTGRRQDGRAGLPGARQGQQHGRDDQGDDRGHRQPAEQGDLGADPSGAPVVGDIDRESGQRQVLQDEGDDSQQPAADRQNGQLQDGDQRSPASHPARWCWRRPDGARSAPAATGTGFAAPGRLGGHRPPPAQPPHDDADHDGDQQCGHRRRSARSAPARPAERHRCRTGSMAGSMRTACPMAATTPDRPGPEPDSGAQRIPGAAMSTTIPGPAEHALECWDCL